MTKRRLKRGSVTVILVAFMAAVLVNAAIAGFVYFALTLRIPTVDQQPEEPEEFVTEYIEEPADDREPSEVSDDQLEAEDPTRADVSPEANEQSPQVEEPPDQPEEEQEPEQPPEQAPPPEQVNRQSVDQPTTNEEVPQTDDYYLAAVDNTAEEETIAESATDEDQESAPVSEQSAESEQETPPEAEQASDEAREAEREEVVEETSDQQEREPQSAEEMPRGEPDAATELAERLEAQAQEGQEAREAAQAPSEQSTPTSPLALDERGEVEAPEQSEAGQTWRESFSLDSAMRQAEAREARRGEGEDSITREGAVAADRYVEETFGERTAAARERLARDAREASLLGDQAGQWERTRQAMENYDVAVTTGTETHLNTRRSEHAPFINAYHRRVHDRWWDFLSLLNSRYSGEQAISDPALAVRLEIRVMSDGSINTVRIVRTSGNTFFDSESIRIQYDIGTTTPPSENILCEDGSVYLHWTFSRTPGRCGTHRAGVHCPG